MKKALFVKISLILALIVFFIIIIFSIRNVANERVAWRDEAVHEVSKSIAEMQRIAPPLLVIPYNKKIFYTSVNQTSKKEETRYETEKRLIYFIPEQVEVEVGLKADERRKGIYKIPFYDSTIKVSGHFSIPKDLHEKNENRNVTYDFSGSSYLIFFIKDQRGIKDFSKLSWQGEEMNFKPGSGLIQVLPSGMHIEIAEFAKNNAAIGNEGNEYKFSFQVNLKGVESLEVIPLAKRIKTTFSSNWPDPSFFGRFLPDERQINADGFTATWKISEFSSNMADVSNIPTSWNSPHSSILNEGFGVRLIKLADAYQQTMRTLKYGILFISLTFTAAFLFEIIKKTPIHPIQYGMVGLALSVFYLLLLSLSERIIFAAAYAIAAFACSGIITYYAVAVLKSSRLGYWFGCILLLLYGSLYVIIQSEENSLLLGSILLFMTVAIAMFITRDVDWYKAGENN